MVNTAVLGPEVPRSIVRTRSLPSCALVSCVLPCCVRLSCVPSISVMSSPGTCPCADGPYSGRPNLVQTGSFHGVWCCFMLSRPLWCDRVARWDGDFGEGTRPAGAPRTRSGRRPWQR